MGYNSIILIRNDDIHQIDEDPEKWWQDVRAAIQGHNIEHTNLFKVVSCEHADYNVVIVAGGNTAKVIGITNQQDQNGLFICHKCDNRKCVRLDHLFYSPSCKLTEAQVIEIRNLYKNSLIGDRKLAERYGLARNTIQKILKGQTWRHLLDCTDIWRYNKVQP